MFDKHVAMFGQKPITVSLKEDCTVLVDLPEWWGKAHTHLLKSPAAEMLGSSH